MEFCGHGQHSTVELVPALILRKGLLRRMLASAFIVGASHEIVTPIDIQFIMK